MYEVEVLGEKKTRASGREPADEEEDEVNARLMDADRCGGMPELRERGDLPAKRTAIEKVEKTIQQQLIRLAKSANAGGLSMSAMRGIAVMPSVPFVTDVQLRTIVRSARWTAIVRMPSASPSSRNDNHANNAETTSVAPTPTGITNM